MATLIRRLGNKQRIAQKIIQYFPTHVAYIEMFFGAGGIFFNKRPAKYNFLNDFDKEIINVFDVLRKNKDELYNFILSIPYHQDIFKYFKENPPTNDIERAGVFLIKSNWQFMGEGGVLHFRMENNKQILLQNMVKTYNFITQNNVQFLSIDFRKVLKNISFQKESDKNKVFIYADPPYLNTVNNYNTDNWTEQDTIDLFEILVNSKIRFALSEFDNPLVLDLAKKYSLNIITIGERQNLRNRRIEILITNYKKQLTIF